MVKLEVNEGSVKINVTGSGMDIVQELGIGNLALLKGLAMNADMYIGLRDILVKILKSVTYDEIEEEWKYERKSNDL